MGLTKKEIEKFIADDTPMVLYNIWLPETLYTKIRYFADVEKMSLNRAIIELIETVLKVS